MENKKLALYDLLGVSKDAGQGEITKAFRLMALKVHPDKNPSDENAQKNFQKLNEAYEILKDPKKREIYDLTGEVENNDEFFEAYEYYRGVYPRVKEQDIDDFAARYKGSSEEVEDLVWFYLKSNGDMKELLFHVPLSEESDLPRFWKILDELIEAEKLPKKKKYKLSKKKVKKIKEKKEEIVEDEAQDKGGFMLLYNKIRNKEAKDPDSFYKHLEEKYGSKPSKKKKVK